MQLRMLISEKGLSEEIRKILSYEMEEMTDDYLSEVLNDAKSKAITQSKAIRDELNAGEEKFERLDPALQGLRTDQWRAYIRKNPAATFKGGFMRDKKGRFAAKYMISIWNMQKPFFYRFDFRDKALPLYVKKNNAPQWAQDLGKDNRLYVTPDSRAGAGGVVVRTQYNNQMIYGTLTNERYHREYKPGSGEYTLVPNRTSKAISGKRKVRGRNGTGGVFHSVGNLAAVRLSQKKGIVTPREGRNGWIVFWNNGKVRTKVNKYNTYKMDDSQSGYVFVKSRQMSGKGHERYRDWVMSVLENGTLGFIDDIWHK